MQCMSKIIFFAIQEAETTVGITVSDDNDNEPQFLLQEYEFVIPENLPPQFPVGRVRVSD